MIFLNRGIGTSSIFYLIFDYINYVFHTLIYKIYHKN